MGGWWQVRTLMYGNSAGGTWSQTAATCRSGALPRPPPGHVPKHDQSINITLFSKNHCWKWVTWTFGLSFFPWCPHHNTFSFPGLIYLTSMKWNFTPNPPWGTVFSGGPSGLSAAMLQMWQVPLLGLPAIQSQMSLTACLTQSPLYWFLK